MPLPHETVVKNPADSHSFADGVDIRVRVGPPVIRLLVAAVALATVIAGVAR